MSFRTVLTDPMLRMLVAAIAVAALLPATGDARGWAQMVANAAIFVLFLLNGMRIARRDIVAGFANWRFLVPLVLWVFGAMALVGLALASIGQGLLAPSVALGLASRIALQEVAALDTQPLPAMETPAASLVGRSVRFEAEYPDAEPQ